MITCNGAMKTGTHLLLSAVSLFGVKTRHAHDEHGVTVAGPHLHVIRHPKNVLVSWCRYVYQNDSEQILIDNMFRAIRPVMAFAPWLDEEGVLTVRYEYLLEDPNSIEIMGRFLGLEPVEDHHKRIHGTGPTYTGNPCHWQDHWTPRLQQAWEDADGREAEIAYGYLPV